jgi:hypothetical protein
MDFTLRIKKMLVKDNREHTFEILEFRYILNMCCNLSELKTLVDKDERPYLIFYRWGQLYLPSVKEFLFFDSNRVHTRVSVLFASTHLKFCNQLTSLTLQSIKNNDKDFESFGGLHQYLSNFMQLKYLLLIDVKDGT